jgi:hypothetical protein
MTRPIDLETAVELRRIAGRNSSKADIVVYRVQDKCLALKDYSSRPWWLRWILGRWLIARESHAYRCAAGIPGLATFLGRPSPWALATEWIDGQTLREFGTDRPVPPQLLPELRRILDELHARGIALGDLHRSDILIAANGEIRIVDLATAVCSGRIGSGWLFQHLRRQDKIALARLEAHVAGGDEAVAVAALGEKVLRQYQRSRRLKATWNRLRGKGS